MPKLSGYGSSETSGKVNAYNVVQPFPIYPLDPKMIIREANHPDGKEVEIRWDGISPRLSSDTAQTASGTSQTVGDQGKLTGDNIDLELMDSDLAVV